MRTYQSFTIIGRLGQEPVTRNSATKIVSLSLATSRSFKKNNSDEWQEETTWHNVSTFGQVAERAEKLRKGDVALVVGEIRSRKYTDSQGIERTVYEVHAHSCQLMDRKKDDSAPQQQYSAPAMTPSNQHEQPFPFADTTVDEDLPF